MDNLEELLGEPETSPEQSDNEIINGPKKICGKFADIDELSRAYENLEKDYSRKSMELATLTKQQGGPVVEHVNRDDVIKEYLTSIAKSQAAPTVITTASDIAFGNNSEPKSLRDVESVAENFFRTKENIK